MTLENILNNSGDFARFLGVNLVVFVNSLLGLVGRNLHNVKAVNSFKFAFLCLCSTCHTAELTIHTEEVLEGDCCKSSVFSADCHSFLGFNCLVQALVIASAHHNSACKLVNNEDFTVIDDIVTISLHHIVRSQCLLDMMIDVCVVDVGEVVNSEILFCLLDAVISEHNSSFLLLNGEVILLSHCTCKAVCLLIKLARLATLS